MKKLILFTIAAAAVLFLAAGCASRKLVPEEVLRVPKHAAMKTAYNLWYVEPKKMTSDNVQQGTMLRLGTDVLILSMNEDEVVFKAEGKTFTITLTSNQNASMEAFAAALFTQKKPEEYLAGTPPAVMEKIRRGIVTKNMTRQQVFASFGPPVMARTLSLQNNTWIYQADNVKSRRVVFLDNRVLDVLELD